MIVRTSMAEAREGVQPGQRKAFTSGSQSSTGIE
jgi:hypothetical protein